MISNGSVRYPDSAEKIIGIRVIRIRISIVIVIAMKMPDTAEQFRQAGMQDTRHFHAKSG